MQTQDGMRVSQTALTLLGMAALVSGGLSVARAQTGGTTSGSQTGGTMNGSMSGQSGTMTGQTGQGGTMQSGTMSGGRQGRRGRDRASRQSSSNNNRRGPGGGLSSAQTGRALMDDTSGFANFYTNLDQDNQQNLREVYEENIDRLYPNDEDPVFIMPAPWNYPAAAPGAIDTYHYADYTHDHLFEGSVYDSYVKKARLMRAREMAQMRRARELRQQLGRTSGGMMNGGGTRSGSNP